MWPDIEAKASGTTNCDQRTEAKQLKSIILSLMLCFGRFIGLRLSGIVCACVALVWSVFVLSGSCQVYLIAPSPYQQPDDEDDNEV